MSAAAVVEKHAPRVKGSARDRLLAAARELLQERGYESLEVREIAARAGVSRQTFYNNFASKRECVANLASDPELKEIEGRVRAAETRAREWAPELGRALERTFADQHASPDTPRARLLRAADESVRSGGFAQARVAHLTEAAGVSRRDFYVNFADKRECLAALTASAVAAVSQVLEDAIGSTAPIELTRSLPALANALRADSHRARLAVIEVLNLSFEFPADARHAYAGSFRDLLGRLVARDPRVDAPLERRIVAGALADAVESAVAERRLDTLGDRTSEIDELLVAPLALESHRTKNGTPSVGTAECEGFRGRRAPATRTDTHPREETTP